MTMTDILSQFIVPALVGGAGGFATSWVTWDIEKRRARFSRRAQLVDGWRNDLIAKLEEGLADGHNLNFAFMTWPTYASLRPHLTQETIAKIEGPQRTAYVMGDFPRRNLIDEIGRIERRWKLA
jgi:hypothetical protein